MRMFVLVLAAFTVLVFSPRSAHAYLDPASGSMLLQLLFAGVAGLAVVVKLYWRKVKAYFSPGTQAQDSSEDVDADNAD